MALMPDDTTLEGVEQFADESREFAEASLPLAAEILPDDTTAPVTAELRERIKTAAVQWLVSCPFPLLGISGSTPSQALTESSQALAETWGRELTDLVVAALAGDPGDLPARMAEAIAEEFTPASATLGEDGEYRDSTLAERADKGGLAVFFTAGDGHRSFRSPTAREVATAAMSVHWGHAASQAAEVERLRAELTETVAAHMAYRQQTAEVMAERDALTTELGHAQGTLSDTRQEVDDLTDENRQLRDERDLLRETLAESDLGGQVLAQWEAIAAADADRDRLGAENERMWSHLVSWRKAADDVGAVVHQRAQTAEAELVNLRGFFDAMTDQRDALKAAIEQIEIAFIIKRDGIRQRDPNDHDRGAAQVMEIVEDVFAATLAAPETTPDAREETGRG